MNKIIICFLLSLLLASCSKTVEERSHTVVNILDGNTIALKDGLEVTLIGIEPTEEAHQYLADNVLNTKVKFYTDRSNRQAITNAGQEVFAYLKTNKGISVNGEILKRKLSSLDTNYLTDSLSAFKAYASGERLQEEESSLSKEEISLPDKPYQPIENKSLRELVKMAEPTVFLIYALDRSDNIVGSGTGFFINEEGLAVSNDHVFKGAHHWKIKTKSGKYYPVSAVIKADEKIDYVIFKVSVPKSPYLKLSRQLPEKGEDIFVLGNPKGLESTVTRGVVSAFRDIHTKNDFIQIDAAISPGSSGSPVMNMQGEVVGIATAKLEACENCNFAVNIQLVEKALDNY